ncbi:MAG: sulfurtransferase TusA family protein [Thermodesulfobacteriota bacterium]|nr:sulfurtransferase TusA family protein [Thermodesulfobacteriota bacterium]
MKKGQVLEMLNNYDGAVDDIPEWCEKCGQDFVGMYEDDDFYRLYITRNK